MVVWYKLCLSICLVPNLQDVLRIGEASNPGPTTHLVPHASAAPEGCPPFVSVENELHQRADIESFYSFPPSFEDKNDWTNRPLKNRFHYTQ